jgi:hypothetical protein
VVLGLVMLGVAIWRLAATERDALCAPPRLLRERLDAARTPGPWSDRPARVSLPLSPGCAQRAARYPSCLEATAPLRIAALSIALSLIVRLGQCRLWVPPTLRRRRRSNAAARALLSLSREFALVDDCRLQWRSDTLTDCRARRSRRSARRDSLARGIQRCHAHIDVDAASPNRQPAA